MKKGVWALLVAGVGYGLYRLAGNASKLQFGNVKLNKTTYSFPLSLEFHMTQPITNPTTTNFPFKGIEGGAFYGKTKIADFKLDGTDKIVLKTNTTVNVPIAIKVDLLKLSSDVRDMVKNGNWLNAATLKGVVRSDINFPFESKIF